MVEKNMQKTSYTLQTYQILHIHLFLSAITHLGIFSQMSRKFTIH